MKKTIIHVIHNLQIGGVETAVRSSIDYLNEENDFWVVSIRPNESRFIEGIKRKDRIVCFNLHSWFAPVNLVRLYWFILSKKPEIIFSSLWKAHAAIWVFRMLFRKKNIVPIVHSSTFFHFADAFFGKRMISGSPFVLADSSASSRFIEQLYPGKEVRVINFVLNRHAGGRAIPDFSGNHIRMVFIGRLFAIKRLDRAVQLVKKIKDSGTSVSLDIYGPDVNIKESLLAKIMELNLQEVVTFHDELPPDQVHSELKKYQFFIQVSDAEGMAMSVVESLQAGLIPIVTQVGEMQYYVQHMKNGIMISRPFDDLEETTNILNGLILNKEKLLEMSNNAVETFSQKPIYREDMRDVINTYIQQNNLLQFISK